MNGEILVAVLLGVMITLAILESVGRVAWCRVWDEAFADTWIVRVGRSLLETVAGAVMLLTVMVTGLAIQTVRSVRWWWREKIFMSPRVSTKTFGHETRREDEDALAFFCEVGILVWRLLLWLAITTVATTFRQLHAEQMETKRVFVKFADSADAEDRFCRMTLPNRQAIAGGLAKSTG